MHASDRLRLSGIPFERKQKGRLLTIRHAGRTIDFWPSIGLWIDRALKRRRLGVRALIQEITK